MIHSLCKTFWKIIIISICTLDLTDAQRERAVALYLIVEV